jgi:putative sigma-54 modulation protein
MIVHYTARQTALTPEVKQYCDRRLKSLEKLMRRVLEVDLIFATARKRHLVEIHVKAKGSGLVVQDEDPELRKALSLAFDNLEKKLKKDKDKVREKKRRPAREASFEAPPLGMSELGRRIIPGSDVSSKPMTVEEAVLVLDEAKKDVLVFRKLGSERWAVLYRRKDGHYGLVEPEG